MRLIGYLSLITLGSSIGLQAGTPVPLHDPVEVPSLEKAEVTLPYLELKKLWEAAQAAEKLATPSPPPEPPPPGVVLSANFKADLSGGHVALDAEFKVESFSDKWESIPLMEAGPSVLSADPVDTRLTFVDKKLCVSTKKTGPATIKVHFSDQAFPTGQNPTLLRLGGVNSAVASLEITGLPEGRLIKEHGGAVLPLRDGKVTAALHPFGDDLALEWEDAKMAPVEIAPPPPPQPSEWTVQNEVLVYEDEGQLHHVVHAHLTALNGSALEATVLLPAHARSVKLESADLDLWKMAQSTEVSSEVRIHWQTRDLMERDVTLSYSLQQLPLAPTWELKAPYLSSENRTHSLFIFPLTPGIEFQCAGLRGPILPSRLPRWMADQVKDTEFGAVDASNTASLQCRLLPRVDTAEAIVPQAKYTTRLVTDGSTITEAHFDIEHEQSLYWSFSLPEKSELLKCAVDDVPTRPIARDQGRLELPLTAAQGKKSTTTSITLSYTAQKGKLAPLEGDVTLELPLTPLLVEQTDWSVEIPGAYEVSVPEDQMEIARGKDSSQDSANTIHLIKKLCRNERPQAQLFYRKRGINE